MGTFANTSQPVNDRYPAVDDSRKMMENFYDFLIKLLAESRCVTQDQNLLSYNPPLQHSWSEIQFQYPVTWKNKSIYYIQL